MSKKNSFTLEEIYAIIDYYIKSQYKILDDCKKANDLDDLIQEGKIRIDELVKMRFAFKNETDPYFRHILNSD